MAGSIHAEPVPLVIVQGFLGTSGSWIWGTFEHYLNQDLHDHKLDALRRTIFVSVGPVSSLHDRACELYYALVGGTVDYGEEHSAIHGHARYGRNILQGQYPEWSAGRPVHFFGHSIGGPTIIKLQQLIKHGHFGPNAHPRMILSVTTVSAPFRGTSAVYFLGERTDAAPSVRPFSVGALLGKGVHLLSFLSPLLPEALDMHGDCRSLTYRDISIRALLKQLWRSDWAESRDATPFDVTFQAADEREFAGEGEVEPDTYYQSHVVCMTRRCSRKTPMHTPSMQHLSTPLMYLAARSIGAFDYSVLKPTPTFFHPHNADCGSSCTDNSECKIMGEEYWANDGIVPVFSQWHPFSCGRTRCQHFSTKGADDDLSPQPGIWYVRQECDAHHMSIVPWWTGTNRQKRFWVKLGRWLKTVEENRPPGICTD